MSPILETSFATWALGDQLVTPKGGKICLLNSNGARVSLESSFAPMQAPFGPSTYDKQPASRMNLALQCGEPTQAFFERLNDWTKDYTQAHAERLFKKPMTREEIDAGYRSPLSVAGEYLPLVRTKITIEGPKACKFWTLDGKPREPPEDWRKVSLRPILSISHLYIMGKEFGWVVRCTDIQICDNPQASCPFARSPSPVEEDEAM